MRGMKIFGAILIVCSVIGIIVAFNMDTSVSSSYCAERTHNI